MGEQEQTEQQERPDNVQEDEFKTKQVQAR